MYRDDLIRAAMGAQNMSQGALAEKSDLNPNTISAICRGKERIEIPTLKKVADALGLSMQELFTPKPEISETVEEPAASAA